MFFVAAGQLQAVDKRPLTFTDMMKFKAIRGVQLSDNGEVLAYTLKPDRGNPRVLVRQLKEKKDLEIDGGEKPIVTANGKFVAASLPADFLALEKDKKKKLKPGMVLLDTGSGKQVTFERIKSFKFSKNSSFLVYQFHPQEEKKGESAEAKTEDKAEEKKSEKKKERTLHRFVLRHLADGKELSLDATGAYALDPEGRFVAVETITPGEKPGASLAIYRLDSGANPRQIDIQSRQGYELSTLVWSKKKSRLAFLWSQTLDENEHKVPATELWMWDGLEGKPAEIGGTGRLPAGWMIPPATDLKWSEIASEDLLYVGLKPVDDYLFYHPKKDSSESGEEQEENDGYDIEKILEKRGVDVWHWRDPMIKPQAKVDWKKNKKKTFRAVYRVSKKTLVPLGDKELDDISIPHNDAITLASTRVPYMVESTWTQRFKDYYLVNLKNGKRKKVLTRHQGKVQLSPLGKYLVYFSDGHWYLLTVATGKKRNLTAALDVPFANEDHDYPSPAPSYGISGWLERDKGVLVYDKYDIWLFHTKSGKFECLTAGYGRQNHIDFRVVKTDPDQKFFTAPEELLLKAHSHRQKTTHFYKLPLERPELVQLVDGQKKFRFVKKAKEANVYLYSRESYTEFPDLRVTDSAFGQSEKVTAANPQMKEFLWGSAELVEWKSADGVPLQGIVMKPENFDPNKRYPVLVYYYRLISQRLFDFSRPVVNHRPCFPFYTGNDYVVFLPDIKFKIGTPGFSATKCLVPGVQKLVDMGIADPEAVALHGHSWSGYQTAFVITQTDVFAAAIAGAPVSNMTSAYSGIRWGSGLARQFQYEVSQSRIGGSLWQYPEKYIENSPVFFANRINTPLLMMHGDVDGAVPWYQSIEMYLAMRRLGKECVFLQYNDEPHHLKKYPNKLDYAKKMKEYLDYYLKKAIPAPKWIGEGMKYQKR
jgi:dipeptidyl aminopeptidase/acylaminoacyl peptidase